MATIPEALATAIQHHQNGRLPAAEQIYREILEADPNQPDALHLLGVLAHDSGNNEVAVELIGRAIELKSNSAEFHYNLAGTYSALRKIPEAIACYNRVIELRPDFAEAHYNLGNLFKEQRNADEAIACYRRALDSNPAFVEALFNWGVTLIDQGRLADAVGVFRRLLELRPGDVDALGSLASALKDLGQWTEAIDNYRKALDRNPTCVAFQYRLGELLVRQDQLTEAEYRFREVIRLQPDFSEAHGSLGSIFQKRGQLDEALTSYRFAVRLQPHSAIMHNNLGLLLQEQGQHVEAIGCFHRAVQLKPDFVDAYSNLGNVLREYGAPAEAMVCFSRVLELRPDDAEAFNKLGNSLRDLTRLEEAIICYRRAVELRPDFAEAYNNLGNVLKESGQMCEAVVCYERAIELKADFAVALNNLGVVLNGLGRHEESISRYRRALDIQPDYSGAHSNLLMTMQYCDGITLAALADAHAEFDRRHAAPLFPAKRPLKNTTTRLRVGFVSSDFGRHPVGYFLVGAFENLSHHSIETICYSQRIVKDDFTERFRSASTQWRDVVGLTDERLVEQIREDRIDILFDLAGHTARNRILVFARKPAPIQIAWIGYEGTTGLSAMDYLLADEQMIPKDAEKYYRETILRMPDGYVCYERSETAPSVGSLPLSTNGYATFGSFNNPAKLTSKVIEVWSKILRSVPNSKLVLKYRGLTEPAVKQHFIDEFSANGVDPLQLELLPQSSYADYLSTYQRIDVALDPFPFVGGATTCEALWMGVPVLTWPGETFAGRHSLSHLVNVGLTEMVAAGPDDYVEMAVSLAGNAARLSEIRSSLRERMATSPLCNTKRFADNLAAMLQRIWKQQT
jgi:predicted O-linked N-acetylglucosamine transferase (SPINDLY family)